MAIIKNGLVQDHGIFAKTMATIVRGQVRSFQVKFATGTVVNKEINGPLMVQDRREQPLRRIFPGADLFIPVESPENVPEVVRPYCNPIQVLSIEGETEGRKVSDALGGGESSGEPFKSIVHQDFWEDHYRAIFSNVNPRYSMYVGEGNKNPRSQDPLVGLFLSYELDYQALKWGSALCEAGSAKLPSELADLGYLYHCYGVDSEMQFGTGDESKRKENVARVGLLNDGLLEFPLFLLRKNIVPGWNHDFESKRFTTGV